MKPFARYLFVSLLLLTALPLRAGAQVATNDVYELKFSASAAVQDDLGGSPAIAKFKITGDNLLNLAVGREPDAVVPANEKLALLIPRDEGEISIVVVDTATTNLLAVVATDQGDEGVSDAKGGLVIIALDVKNVGVPANRLLGGDLFLSLSFAQDAAEVLTKAKATVIGVLNVTVESEDETVLLTKGKLSTGALLATVVDEPL